MKYGSSNKQLTNEDVFSLPWFVRLIVDISTAIRIFLIFTTVCTVTAVF